MDNIYSQPNLSEAHRQPAEAERAMNARVYNLDAALSAMEMPITSLGTDTGQDAGTTNTIQQAEALPQEFPEAPAAKIIDFPAQAKPESSPIVANQTAAQPEVMGSEQLRSLEEARRKAMEAHEEADRKPPFVPYDENSAGKRVA